MKRQDWVLQAVSGLIALLAAGNIFFIKRLVDNIDDANASLAQIQIDLAVLKATVLKRQPDANNESALYREESWKKFSKSSAF
jgi:hypothetical protein